MAEEKKDPRWEKLLEKLNDIPTLPIVATRVTELINNPNSSSGDIAEVLKKDQVLTAKVLKLINSPYYGIPGEVTDVQRALAYLGFNTIAQLVLGISIFTLFARTAASKFSMYEFWRHALATAVASELIAKKVNYPKPEECFTCGLLHDIGKIVLYQIAPDTFLEVVHKAEEQKVSFSHIEKELNIPPHGYLGEYIANKWRLPMIIRLSIRYHHFDVTNMGSILESMKPAIQIVGLANQMVIKENIGNSGDASGGHLYDYFVQPLRLTEDDIKELIEELHVEMGNASAFLRAAA